MIVGKHVETSIYWNCRWELEWYEEGRGFPHVFKIAEGSNKNGLTELHKFNLKLVEREGRGRH